MKRLHVLFLSLSLLSIASPLLAMEAKSEQQLNEDERKLGLLDLPDELLVHIFEKVSRLHDKAYGSLPCVCSRFERIINDETLIHGRIKNFSERTKIFHLASLGTQAAKQLLKELLKDKCYKKKATKLIPVASQAGMLNLIHILLESGINPEDTSFFKNPNYDHPLSIITRKNNARGAQLLLEFGANVNQKEDTCFLLTPLTIAAEKKFITLVELYAPRATVENIQKTLEIIASKNLRLTLEKKDPIDFGEVKKILENELEKRRIQNNSNNNQN